MPERPCGRHLGSGPTIAAKCILQACLEDDVRGIRGSWRVAKEMPCTRPQQPVRAGRHPRKDSTMSERTTLPVLPLRETVIFPGTAVPISAGRPGTLQAIEAALAGDRRMLAAAQRENRDEVESDNLYSVGTVVRIAQVQRGGGGVQLLIHGEHRAMALQYVDTPDRGLTAHVREMHDLPPVNAEDPAFIALYRELR